MQLEIIIEDLVLGFLRDLQSAAAATGCYSPIHELYGRENVNKAAHGGPESEGGAPKPSAGRHTRKKSTSRSVREEGGEGDLIKAFRKAFGQSYHSMALTEDSSHLGEGASTTRAEDRAKQMARHFSILTVAYGHLLQLRVGPNDQGSLRQPRFLSNSSTSASRSTIRDVYYSDTALYESQTKTERAVDAVCDVLSRFIASSITDHRHNHNEKREGDVSPKEKEGEESARREPYPSISRGSEPERIDAPQLHISREALGFGASARSILVGDVSFRIESSNGSRVVRVGQSGTSGVAISTDMGCHANSFEFGEGKRDAETCKYIRSSSERGIGGGCIDIYVVEKECTLTSMLQHDGALEGKHFGSPGAGGGRGGETRGERGSKRTSLFVCGKGYPCVASRSLLKKILESAMIQSLQLHTTATADSRSGRTAQLEGVAARVNLYFVVDGDADGMLIMLSYLAGLLDGGGGATARGRGRRGGGGTSEVASCAASTSHGSTISPSKIQTKRDISHPINRSSFAHLSIEWLGLRPSSVPQLQRGIHVCRDGINASDGSVPITHLPITFASPRCLARLKTICRTSDDIIRHCAQQAMLNMQETESLRQNQSGQSNENTEAVAVVVRDREEVYAKARLIIASRIHALLTRELPSEVDHFARTRTKAELQLVATAAAAAATAESLPRGEGGFDLSTTLGILFSLRRK